MTDPYYILVLWFMRDLNDADRAALLRLYGKVDAPTRAEQQRRFRKILLDAAVKERSPALPKETP